VKFEWDPKKAEHNFKKHGVTFEEASTVFGDPLAATVPDPRHSAEENRFVTMGQSTENRLVVVANIDRSEQVRIIIARLATRAREKEI